MTITEMLKNVRSGALEAEINAELKTLVEEVQRTGKKGALIITLTSEPAGSEAQYLNGLVKSKLPDPNTQATLFYVTEDGELSRRDPKQPELPLRLESGGAE